MLFLNTSTVIRILSNVIIIFLIRDLELTEQPLAPLIIFEQIFPKIIILAK